MKFENMEWLRLLCNLIFYHFQRAKRNLKMKSIEDYAYAALLFLRIFPVLFISYNRSISVDATANNISLQSFHVSCQTYKYISFPRPSSLNDSLSSLIGDKVWCPDLKRKAVKSHINEWNELQYNCLGTRGIQLCQFTLSSLLYVLCSLCSFYSSFSSLFRLTFFLF